MSEQMKINVGVIFGGRSVEHEVSIISAHQAIAAMNADKYHAVPIYISKEGQWYSGEDVYKRQAAMRAAHTFDFDCFLHYFFSFLYYYLIRANCYCIDTVFW